MLARKGGKGLVPGMIQSARYCPPLRVRLNMPALIPGGPKLPSYQKLKSKKRARPEPVKEDRHAPKSKKPVPAALAGLAAPTDSDVKPEKPRKAQKKNAWNKRMAEERMERIQKKDNPNAAPARPARTKATPGSNWQQLKVREHPIPQNLLGGTPSKPLKRPCLSLSRRSPIFSPFLRAQ